MKYIILLNCTIKTNGCYRRVLPVQLNMQISVAKSPRPCAALQHVRVAVAVAAAITLLSPGVACFGPPSKPNIISILQDDLGNYDTGITNADATPYTPNITALSKDGIILSHHCMSNVFQNIFT